MTKVMIAMLATAVLATSASSASAKNRQDMAVLKKPAAMASNSSTAKPAILEVARNMNSRASLDERQELPSYPQLQAAQ